VEIDKAATELFLHTHTWVVGLMTTPSQGRGVVTACSMSGWFAYARTRSTPSPLLQRLFVQRSDQRGVEARAAANLCSCAYWLTSLRSAPTPPTSINLNGVTSTACGGFALCAKDSGLQAIQGNGPNASSNDAATAPATAINKAPLRRTVRRILPPSQKCTESTR